MANTLLTVTVYSLLVVLACVVTIFWIDTKWVWRIGTTAYGVAVASILGMMVQL